MTSLQQHNQNTAQIRLLISPKMLQELNTLAASRYTTRLALIRFYLRRMIEKELSELSEHLKQREQFQATRLKLQNYLDEINQ